MNKLISLAALAALSSSAFASSITTSFTTDSGGLFDWTVFVDLNVASGITVTHFDVNVFLPGVTVDLDIYARTGTASGFEQSSVGWTLVSMGSGVGAGGDAPTAVDTTDFALGAGITGLALHHRNNFVNYINANGTNEFYSNADLSLTAISASNSTAAGFDGSSVYSPRVFSGTIYYDAVPEPTTMSIIALASIAALRKKRK